MKWLNYLSSALGQRFFIIPTVVSCRPQVRPPRFFPGRGGRFTANGSFSGSRGCRACTFQRGDADQAGLFRF